jgi:hypothetical protein
MAPGWSGRRDHLVPTLEMRPSRSSPPLGCGFGVRPSRAEEAAVSFTVVAGSGRLRPRRAPDEACTTPAPTWSPARPAVLATRIGRPPPCRPSGRPPGEPGAPALRAPTPPAVLQGAGRTAFPRPVARAHAIENRRPMPEGTRRSSTRSLPGPPVAVRAATRAVTGRSTAPGPEPALFNRFRATGSNPFDRVSGERETVSRSRATCPSAVPAAETASMMPGLDGSAP